MTKYFSSVSLIVLCVAGNPVDAAQNVTYDNDAQIAGAAIVSPEAMRLVLEQALPFCETNAPTVKQESETAHKKWVARHKYYLYLSAGIRRTVIKMYSDPSNDSEKSTAMKKLVEVDFPQLVKGKIESFLAPIREAHKNGVAEKMCRGFVQAIDAGRYDLKTTDPQLTAYFDKNFPQN